jgi:predicted ester cyclase
VNRDKRKGWDERAGMRSPDPMMASALRRLVIAEGEKAVSRVTVRGTHQGEVEEFGPPAGRPVEDRIISIRRVEGGKIVEDWDSYDNLSFMQQLGLVVEQY